MRKVCVLVCCVLIFLAMMMMTSVDAKNVDKKNKKPPKNDQPKDKSTKSESRKEKLPDVNPKMKAVQNKKEKTKPEKKIKNDSTEIPVITANKIDLDHQPEIQRQQDAKDLVLIKLAESVVAKNCSDNVSKSDQLEAIENNVTSLWRHLRLISQPVHVHIHGGHASSPGRGKSGCQVDRSRKGHHNQDNDRNPLSDKQKHHGHSHNHAHDHSHSHAHNQSHDHSHNHSHSHKHKDSSKSHPHNTTAIGSHDRTPHGHGPKSHHHVKHHSKSHSHTHHGRGDRSHKSHHHCKNHTKSHSHTHHGHGDRSHKSRHHSKHHHGHHGHGDHSHTHHRHGDHSHKSHHHSKHHSPGHKFARGHDGSLSKGHYHKGGYGYGDRSTHVHVHLTIEGQLPPVRQEINQSESTSTVPIANDTHTHTPEQIFGRCDFPKNNINHNLVGYVLLRQSPSVLDVAVNISGFHVSVDDADHPGNRTQDPGPRTHGFHVHEFGDFSKGCLSFGSHYNPDGTTHGGPHHHARHVGDWGNIEANDQGRAVTYFSVSDATLQGPHSILGRGIVVHEQADDLGEGGVPASKTTGNAGGRQACCIIGHSKPLPAESFHQPTGDPSALTPEASPTPGS